MLGKIRNLCLFISAHNRSDECKWSHPTSRTSNGLYWDMQSNASHTSLPFVIKWRSTCCDDLCYNVACSLISSKFCTPLIFHPFFPTRLPRCCRSSPRRRREYVSVCCDLWPFLSLLLCSTLSLAKSSNFTVIFRTKNSTESRMSFDRVHRKRLKDATHLFSISAE